MSTLPQLEEKIYSLVPELEYVMNYYGDIGHFPIEINHWLPLLKGDCAIDGNGNVMEVGCAEDCKGFFNGYVQYDFKKSFSEQSPEFHEWLWNQLQS